MCQDVTYMCLRSGPCPPFLLIVRVKTSKHSTASKVVYTLSFLRLPLNSHYEAILLVSPAQDKLICV